MAIAMLLCDFEHQRASVRHSPDEPRPRPRRALTQNLYRAAVDSPGCLAPGAAAVVEVPLPAVEVEQGAVAGSPPVPLDPVECEHVTLGMRFNPHRQALRRTSGGEGGAAGIHLPGTVRSAGHERDA